MSVASHKSMKMIWRVTHLVWAGRLLHIAISANTGTSSSLILAEDGIAVGVGASLQCFLCSGVVLFVTQPCDNASLLQSFSVRERQVPWHLILEQPVHVAQIDSGTLLVVFIQRCLAGQEEDARHGSRNCSQKGVHCVCRNGFGINTRTFEA